MKISENKRKLAGKLGTVGFFLVTLSLLFSFIISTAPKNASRPDSQQAVRVENIEKVDNLSNLIASRQTLLKLPPIGAIAIPALNINLPIFDGDGESQLQNGAGTSGNSDFKSSNFSLAAHHVFGSKEAKQWLFGPLMRAKKGMEVYLADERNIYKFIISESVQVDVHDVYVLDDVEGQKLLTMIYCTKPSGDERTIVRASFAASKPISDASLQEIQYFTSNWNLIPENG